MATIIDFKIIVDGKLDINASVEAFRSFIITYEDTNGVLRDDMKDYINGVLLGSDGAVPIPTLIHTVRRNMGRDSDSNSYKIDSEVIYDILANDKYTIRKGPGGGVWLTSKYNAILSRKKK